MESYFDGIKLGILLVSSGFCVGVGMAMGMYFILRNHLMLAKFGKEGGQVNNE